MGTKLNDKAFIIGDEATEPLLGDVVVCALIFDKAILSIKEDSLSTDLHTADSVSIVSPHP
ncbi:MAG: hypothetical protein U1E91_04695 [Moraxella sp.]